MSQLSKHKKKTTKKPKQGKGVEKKWNENETKVTPIHEAEVLSFI